MSFIDPTWMADIREVHYLVLIIIIIINYYLEWEKRSMESHKGLSGDVLYFSYMYE
jgi:hypothetical protein